MRYPFMTLNDGTEITYSSPIQNGDTIQVCVDMETPVENGFNGYSELELSSMKSLIKSVAHLLMRYSQEGGIESA